MQMSQMKKNGFKVFLTLSLYGALLIPDVRAQSKGPLKVEVPFGFMAGAKAFAAGDYTVKENVAPGTLLIQSADHKASLVIISNSVQSRQTQDESKLVFNRAGDQYYLSQVWTAGSNIGRELIKSSAEREMMAKSEPQPPVILIAHNQK